VTIEKRAKGSPAPAKLVEVQPIEANISSPQKGRSRTSAKSAGSSFERLVADYLKEHVSRFIDRMPKYGANDRGDIANVETFNQLPVALELKEFGGRLMPGPWVAEAEVERLNLPGAIAGVVIAKRRGTTDPGDQFVVMTVRDLVALITGKRP
jgi:hypothetical protein